MVGAVEVDVTAASGQVRPDDVVTAVRFAQEHDQLVAVRSGGHSIALQSVVDDALVIDLSLMKRIEIDPATRTARVEPGATSGDLAWPAVLNAVAWLAVFVAGAAWRMSRDTARV